MAEHANELLPDIDFLAPDFTREVLYHEKSVRFTVKLEVALGKMVGFHRAIHVYGEEAILGVKHRIPEGGLRLGQQRKEIRTAQVLTREEQFFGTLIGKFDVTCVLKQQNRHRSVVHKRVTELLALLRGPLARTKR